MNEEILQEIRSKTDIVETIRSYIPVIKKGKSYAAVCPFHDDHDPSMSISVDKQIYKCFVCGAGGNVFSFVKDFEKISFNEAVIKCAEKAGVALDGSFQKEQQTIDPTVLSYYEALNEYQRFVSYSLVSTIGSQALTYLHHRGLDDKTIDKFEIGYNPKDNMASQYLEAKGIALEYATQANLIRLNEFGQKDVFEDRITFPIHSTHGQILGYSARTLNPDISSKYINTAETKLYQKGKLLYNYHRAKGLIKQEQFVILVEGVMDAIAYDQVDYSNVVASLGTALTSDQIHLLRNLSNTIVLSYDFDKAGISASLKTGRLLSQHGFKVFVAQASLEKDANDTLIKQGIKTLQNCILRKISFIEFVYQNSLKQLDLTNYSQKKEFAKIMMTEINQVNDEFDKSIMIQKLIDDSGFSRDQLQLLAPQSTPILKSNKVQNYRKTIQKQNDLLDWAEKEIIGQMLVSSLAMQIFRQELGYFINELYQKCALKIMHYYRQHDSIVVADFINTLDSELAQECITQIVESDIYYNSYSEKALKDAIIQVKINTIDAQIDQFKQEHQEALVLDENPELFSHYQELLKKRREIYSQKGERNGK